MPESSPTSAAAAAAFDPSPLAAMAVRSTTQWVEMNLAASRLILQTQARTVAAFGLPDWSEWVDGANERARRMWASGTDQVLQTVQRVSATAAELQREMGRLLDTQHAQAADRWEQGLQQLGVQAQQGMEQLREMTLRNAEEAHRRGESVSREFQDRFLKAGEALREQATQAGHELRPTVVQGAELAQASANEAVEKVEQAAPSLDAKQA